MNLIVCVVVLFVAVTSVRGGEDESRSTTRARYPFQLTLQPGGTVSVTNIFGSVTTVSGVPGVRCVGAASFKGRVDFVTLRASVGETNQHEGFRTVTMTNGVAVIGNNDVAGFILGHFVFEPQPTNGVTEVFSAAVFKPKVEKQRREQDRLSEWVLIPVRVSIQERK